MRHIEKTSVFEEDILKLVPLTYRVMTKEKIQDLHEIHDNYRLSYSRKHKSKGYLTEPSYKPISNFIL